MRFWDASALVPLLVRERRTDAMLALLDSDPHVVAWTWTPVELSSAVERRSREGRVDRRQRRQLLERLDVIVGGTTEVADPLAVRAKARALLARHPLRAADAGQLAAAVIAEGAAGVRLPFVCLDGRLAGAAEREGMTVLPELDAP